MRWARCGATGTDTEMQRAMDRLSAFVERRRAVVIAVWLAAIVAAVPLSLRQTHHLTSGGVVVSPAGPERAHAPPPPLPPAPGPKPPPGPRGTPPAHHH